MPEQSFGADVLRPDPERFGQTKGRQLDLPDVDERFSRLEKGRDYEIVGVNNRIHADRKPEDFFLFIRPSGGDVTLTVEPPHWRSITDTTVHAVDTIRVNRGDDFYDEQVPFYAANIKGVGFLKPTAEGIGLEDYDTWKRIHELDETRTGYQMVGLSSKREFDQRGILDTSQYLIEQGIRSEVYWAIGKLKQVYFKGELVSIDQLREKGVIAPNRDYYPYLGVRLVKINNRIQETAESDATQSRKLFERAFEVFNRESEERKLVFPKLEVGNAEHERLFMEEFGRRMGKNTARLLNIGYSHGHLHSANVSLAAEIMDIGTLGHWRTNKFIMKEKSVKHHGVRAEHIKDMRDVAYGLKILRKGAKNAGLARLDREKLAVATYRGFTENFDADYASRVQKIDPENAKKWFEKILVAVLVDGKRLAPIFQESAEDATDVGQIEHWPIQWK